MVIIGKHNGFCSGVKRAVDTAKSIGRDGVYILGELIHNKYVIDEIRSLGVRQIDDVDEIDKGTLIIRSHGVGRDVLDKLAAKPDVEVVDCTCPFVKKIHSIVSEYSKKGYLIIIVGEKSHPEVRGIVGWCEGESVVQQVFDPDFDYNAYENVCIVAQTTCSVEKFDDFLYNFQKNYKKNIAIFKTICYTTMERQREADDLSRTCDAMIVIGGEKSSNTKKLYDICRNNCENVFMIDSSKAFDGAKFSKFKRIGIVSGASTPLDQSQEVFSKMEEITEVKTEVEVTESEAAEVKADKVNAEEVAEVTTEEVKTEEPAAATAAEGKSVMEEAVAQMDSPSQKFRKGQRIKATISSATDEGLALYINGTKKEILLPKEEVNCETYNKADYDAKVGDEIEVMITGLNPVLLSEKAITQLLEEEKEIEEIKNGKIFEAVVDGTNKGGLTARYGSYGVFIPSSQIRIGFVKELDKYVGKTLRLKAEKVESQERRKQIVASQRVILEAEKAEKEAAKKEKEEAFFANVHEGDVVTGKVVRFASFGAFVEVDGFDCLAHITDLVWTGIKAPSEVFEIGKDYDFKVLKVDVDTKKVSLGYKQLQPRPWENVPGKYTVGEVVEGKVVRIVDFGVFVELEPGVDGLVHISQISYEWLEKPTESVKVGQMVEVKIIAIDYEKEKITLSIKAAGPAPEQPAKPRREKPANAGEEGEDKPRRKPRRERPVTDDGEMHEWKDSEGFGGASIAELINKNN